MTDIVNYKKEYAQFFKDLNIAWLEKYFVPEPYDIEVLSNPEKYILDKNGEIYFVLYNLIPVGTVALMYNQNNELEFTKMAVKEEFQGKGFGKLLTQKCIERAKEKGENKLILYSNTLLKPAIQLYIKSGFVEIPLENSLYKRSDIKMVYNF